MMMPMYRDRRHIHEKTRTMYITAEGVDIIKTAKKKESQGVN